MSPMPYACPRCRTSLKIHDVDCSWQGISMDRIEKAHTDILAVMTRAPQTEHDLRENVHGEWNDVHSAVFDRFDRDGRIVSIGKVEQDGQRRDVWKLRTVDEYREHAIVPSNPDLKTVYESGPVDGCKDDAVFAMISHYNDVGLSWEDTREKTIEWLEETGSWSRGSWEESSPAEVVDSKRHVYEKSYGWKEAAGQAATVIGRSGPGGAQA